jgi:GNAT superfamily N-acetyltransferase
VTTAPVWSAVRPLDDDHDLDVFLSGRPSVDTWLQDKARQNSHFVHTHVCVDEAGIVRGFFALRTVVVPVEGLSNRLSRGAQDGFATASLLAQMGVRREDQGGGQGALLVGEAMKKAVEAHKASSLQLFVVDAAEESLVPFYEKYGFARLPNSLRLAVTMSAAVKAVG